MHVLTMFAAMGFVGAVAAPAAGTAAPAVVAGPIAHWNFDEGRGQIAKDVTGNGHDAALKQVDWVPSPRGYALRFDSKADLALYGQVESMNLSGDMTLAVWVKTDATVEPRTNRLIFGDGGAGIERNLNLRISGYGDLRFEWADGVRSASLLAPADLLNGTWKHVVVTCDSARRQALMYVDGQVVAGMSMPMPISKAPVKQRLTGWFYNGYFQGDLDDVRLYARALSRDEVGKLFAAEADLQIGRPMVLFDASGPEPRGVVSVTLRNRSKQPRLVEVDSPTLAKRRIELPPGTEESLPLGEVALKPVWRSRTDLFICDQSQEAGRASITVQRGSLVEQDRLALAPQLVLEPVQLQVKDPWQREMPAGPTQRIELDLRFAISVEQLRQGTVEVRLISRETGKAALRRQVRSPAAEMPLALDVRALPWGAYDLEASFHDSTGRQITITKRLATVLPDGNQRIRPLNNLVSELMDARARGLLGSRRIEFMNPRDGWVWFQASGDCALRLAGDRLLAAAKEKPAAEAMRLLPAGKHVLDVAGAPTGLAIRAVPALLYNVYPSAPQIQPFGSNTWDRLRKHMLPNVNMIESQVIDTPEYREWRAAGKLWLANVQAPGLVDDVDWTPEKLLEFWRKPRGWTLDKIDGIQSDEYYPGSKSMGHAPATVLSLAQLAEDPAFAGKLWIPFVVRLYGNPAAELFMKTSLGAGWPFSVEVYQGEIPTEAEDLEGIRARFLEVATSWESAYPGSLRRAIFTPMYAYLPFCTTNRCPQADFRVHLDIQMQMLATDPLFFGLWGVQPYRSNYVDEEILNCMGMLLRHYAIDGKTDRMLRDPYELRHLTDPDFEQGTRHWRAAPAEEGAITAGKLTGYGQLQGRYPAGAFGDTFLVMKRSAKGPNAVSQQLDGLKRGRLYSVKLISGDYADLRDGKTRKDRQALSIRLDGAEVLEGGFSYPFPSGRGPNPFTREAPFWMTYHWLRFRAGGPTAQLVISDWLKSDEPGGPIGQEVMCNFVEVQPVTEDD